LVQNPQGREQVEMRFKSIVHRICIGLLFSLSLSIDAQTHRIGGGLSFASVNSYNTGETGNPGFSIHYWHSLNRAGTIHLVPSLSVYNPYKLKTGYMVLTNYMFQGDLNLQYTVYNQGTVGIVAFGGVNAIQLISDYKPTVVTGDETLENRSDRYVGGNLGAGLELYMSPKWDLNVSAKYVLSEYSQVVIGVQAAYYFIKRRRAYRR
jgi:hypothetical protein